LFPFLINAYNFLNLSDINVGAPSFTSQNTKTMSVYDYMEINVEMASPIVKE
jgi:hypothetical protein